MAETDSIGALDDASELTWRKSSHSQINGCVEAARGLGGDVLIRNSKRPNEGFLRFDAVEWKAFVAGMADGEFDFLS